MLGYEPTPADPYIFNHRVFPATALLADASTVLGMVVGGPGTRLVGSGGANDVASRAVACVVLSVARPVRLVARADYVTSPGTRVVSVATDLGILRRLDGVLRIAAVAGGTDPDEGVRRLAAARQVEVLDPVRAEEVLALRRYDPQRLFLA